VVKDFHFHHATISGRRGKGRIAPKKDIKKRDPKAPGFAPNVEIVPWGGRQKRGLDGRKGGKADCAPTKQEPQPQKEKGS